jgi:ribosomal protein L37AE/L43A
MEDTSTTGSHSITCPFCEVYELRPFGHNSLRCESCGGILSGVLLETLRQISGLPDASGRHACECGHPEMRRLPDDVYWCPACGSEVLPVSSAAIGPEREVHSGAYWCGWLDGCYGERGSFTGNRRLADWRTASDRLDYYKGHRAGREARRINDRLLDAS